MKKETFEEFFTSNYKKVFRLVYSQLSNKLEAEDLTAEIMLEIFSKFNKLNNPRAYLYSIINKRCLDFFAAHKKRMGITESLDLLILESTDEAPAGVHPESAIDRLDPGTILNHNEALRHISQTLQKVSLEKRKVFLAYYMKDLSISEIVEIYNLGSKNVVYSIIDEINLLLQAKGVDEYDKRRKR